MGRVRWGVLVLALTAALVGGACSGGDDEDMASAGGDGGGREGQVTAESAEGGAAFDDAGSGGGHRSAAALPPLRTALIKTADLRVEVADGTFADAFQDVVALADRHGGFVVSSETSGDDARTGRITIRVPADAFERAVGEVVDLGELKSRRESSEDVSEEFVDLEARLRHLTAQETVMLRLMDRAESIADTIRVQNELTGIQLEIERIRGRLRFLDDQTSLSTIGVVLVEKGIAPDEEDGIFARAWNVGRDTATAIVSGFVIGGAAVAPVLVVALLGLLAFRWLRPRFGRATSS